jgi:DNA-binding beta-propeller fold protein YncE
MSTVVGSGAHRYRVEPDWARPPADVVFGDVAAVGVDRHDRVYVFHRGPHPVLVFAPDGTLVDSFGDGVYPHPHGIQISGDHIYFTDDGDHTVRKSTLDGTVLMVLGDPDRPADFMSGTPFRRCTHTALAPDGDIYVTDGYGNARVHRFSPDGVLRYSFGRPGIGPGEFNLPHSIVCDAAGTLYVADRENHRIQVFDGDGSFRTEWRDLHRPSVIHPMPDGGFIVGELGPVMRFNRGAPNLGPRLSVLDDDGRVVTRIGTEPAAGIAPGQFLSPHGVAVDSTGSIYIAQVSVTAWPQLFPQTPMPTVLPSLIKLVPVTPAAEGSR